MRWAIGGCCAAGLAAVLLCTNQTQAADAVAFRGVRVFDGEKTVEAATVVVDGGVIKDVGPNVNAPEGATVIDGAGKTLLPGLFDGHTHAFNPGHLRQAAIFGVTTEGGVFSGVLFAATVREEKKAGRPPARADLFSAGTLITAPGGHGTEYGIKIPTLAAADQADAFVGARLGEGSDYIKIVYDDGKAAGLRWPTLDRPTVAAVIAAAHARKKPAVVHALARESARQVLAEGADGLVHVFIDQPIDDEFIKLAVEKKAFVMPTLTVIESISGTGSGSSLVDDPELAPLLAPSDVKALKSAFPRRPARDEVRAIPKDAVQKLHSAGVPILAGTDCPNPGTVHGVSVHRELELLVAAGLSPVEALCAATAAPARAFGLNDRGRIAPGLRADLVLVNGDPTRAIKDTRKIAGVWKQGKPVDRVAYRAELAREAESAAKARAMPAPKGSEKGLVSDFEGKTIAAEFGFGWIVSTDSFVGGKSKASLQLAAGGANKSQGALKITGTVEDRSQPRWAGAMFAPGAVPMAPVNLSSKKELVFWARGDGKSYQVMLFTSGVEGAPPTVSFKAGPEWAEHRYKLDQFAGADGSGLMGVFFGGSAAVGPFELWIDDVRFE